MGLPLSQVSNISLFVVLPQMREDLRLTYSELGLVLACFGVARVIFDLPAGALLRRVNPRTALVISLAVTVIAAVAGLTASSAWQVGVARFVHGASTAVVQCAVLAWLVGGAHSSLRGRVMALSEAAFSLTGLAVPLGVGLLATIASWRGAYAMGMGASLLALTGTLLCTDGASGQSALGDVVAGGASEPLRSRWLALRSGGSILLAAYVMTFIIFFGRQSLVTTLLPLLGGELVGLSSVHVGFGLTLVNAVSIGAVMLGGWLGDRAGRWRLIVPGILLLLLCQLSALPISNELTYLVAAALVGVSYFMNPLPVSLVGDQLPARLRADGVAAYRLVGDVGVLLAPTAIGFALDSGGFTAAELLPPLASGLAFLAALAVLRVRRKRM